MGNDSSALLTVHVRRKDSSGTLYDRANIWFVYHISKLCSSLADT